MIRVGPAIAEPIPLQTWVCWSFLTLDAVQIPKHASAMDAIYPSTLRLNWYCFNTRIRRGCDESIESNFRDYVFQYTHPRGMRFIERLFHRVVVISIHASARDAICLPSQRQRLGRFNTRILMGCDLEGFVSGSFILFQYTHPHGMRSARTPTPMFF